MPNRGANRQSLLAQLAQPRPHVPRRANSNPYPRFALRAAPPAPSVLPTMNKVRAAAGPQQAGQPHLDVMAEQRSGAAASPTRPTRPPTSGVPTRVCVRVCGGLARAGRGGPWLSGA